MVLNDYEIKHNDYLRNNGAECTVLLKKDGNFPLETAGNIALYGNGARRTVKGGTGSGEVNSRFFVNVEDGLKNAGFTIATGDWLDKYDRIRNKAERKFISAVKKDAKKHNSPAIVYSMGMIMPEPEYNLPLTATCDTAVYVLARISGEGADRENRKGDILLTDTEIRDIKILNEKFAKFMLVINAGGVVDLTPVMEVKNILVLSQLGVVTGDILANILLGKSIPSGKLATTWAAFDDYQKIGDFGNKNDTHYAEGIYVGYRYFDSLDKKPLFPFGFGLSYTEFSIGEDSISIDGSKVLVKATIANVGKYAGKEVLELYVSKPAGNLDQPAKDLAAFAKTSELKPGEKETVTLSFAMEDIASYSEAKESYILEAGNYTLCLGNSSADTKAIGTVKILDEIRVLQAKNVLGKPDFEDYKTEKKENAEVEPVLVLSADAITTGVVNYERTYEIDPLVKSFSDDDLIIMNIGAFNTDGNEAEMVGNSGLTVAGAAGQTYMGLVGKGVPTLAMADGPAGVRLAKDYAMDVKGVPHLLGASIPDTMMQFMPKIEGYRIKRASYKLQKTDVIKHQYATAIPIGTAIAQSFNTDFAKHCGDIVGFEMDLFNVGLWLAPALNTHRSIQCGRNFEYYSEDPLISGEFTAAITNGVQAYKGRGVTIKHYAANNQEYIRTQNNSQVSERAMREIYLKGFGIAVKKSGPMAVMTSYNLLNGIHTGEHRGLIEDILRAEYGHKGIVMTDWVVDTFINDPELVYPICVAPRTIMAGNDLFMPGGQRDFEQVKEALKKGEVTREQLEINASRLLKAVKGK
ncbi:MAG: glycoside hydrolase family 3 C-terminal domain-containing protein [Lachnospiraceae bacterium]|nr:glycoside hydrolase family 3 C-terminal domain-containing protein [Lachnospiraceae bacterium]